MKRIRNMSICLLLAVFLGSCLPHQQVEKTGIINALGIDFTEEKSIQASLVLFQFTEESNKFTKVLHAQGQTLQSAIDHAELKSLYKIVPGKTKITVFGREVAEQGTFTTIDTIIRNARYPDLLYLAVADSTVKELFDLDEENLSTDIGQFLHALIEQHTGDHNIPRKTLQDFTRIYYDIGHDNVLPIFEIDDGIPIQKNHALFQGDKMVGELSHDEGTYLNLMGMTVKDQQMEFLLPIEPFKDFVITSDENENPKKVFGLTTQVQKGKSKTKLIDPNTLTFETNTKVSMRIKEQTGDLLLESTAIFQLLEKEIKKNMEEKFQKLLEKVQKQNADAFGYGRFYKMTREGKNLTNEEWEEKFPNIKVNFNVDVTIVRHGSID